NYLGIYAKNILNNPSSYNFVELLSAIYAYAVQIYCDFSGYVDLVSAFALMLGFTLPLNFNMPYLAKNLKDFWARWHISLSTFIRDYIYIPLGGSRKGKIKTILNLLIAFALSGIWHGSTINFLIWGLLHGLGVVFIHLISATSFSLKKIPALGRFITFQFVCFAWIFFYYSSLEEAYIYIKTCYDNFFLVPEYKDIYVLVAFAVLFMIYPLFVNFKEYCVKILDLTPFLLKPFIIAFILLLVFAFMPNGIPDFIYSSF
ncbi:MAG: MBOAT family protein, partial [Campylobacter sp.]|nr:MBOAT family protein [Campylobacter sp.]